MKIGGKFKVFCNNLVVDEATQKTISSRYKKITQRLNKEFWSNNSLTKHSLYVGSYGRNTAVRGFSDLDILFCLPSYIYEKYNNYTSNGQSALLQAFKSSIQKTYSTTSISGDGQVAVINFTDGIKFEIVPAFKNSDSSFTYPDSKNGGSWKETNPIPEITTLRNNNTATNYNLVRLCRMTRAWRNKWNVKIGGLLIDTLANQFLMQYKYKDKGYLYYDCIARDFFLYLANQRKSQLYWRAVGSNQYVYRKGPFEYKAKQCYKLAMEAIQLEKNNYVCLANNKWREIYGSAYPNQSVS